MISFNKIYKDCKKENQKEVEEKNIGVTQENFAVLNSETFDQDFRNVMKYGLEFWKFFKNGSCLNLPMFTEPPEPVAVKRISSELNINITAGTSTSLAFVPFINRSNFYINGTQTPLTTLTATNCFSTYKIVAGTIRIKQVGIMSLSDGYGTVMDAIMGPPTDVGYLDNNFLNIQTGPYKKLTLVDGRKGIKASFIGSTLYPSLEDSEKMLEGASYFNCPTIPISGTNQVYFPAFTTLLGRIGGVSFYDSQNVQHIHTPGSEKTYPFDILRIYNSSGENLSFDLMYRRPKGDMLFVKISPPSIDISIKVYFDFIVQGKTFPEFSTNMPQVTPPSFFPFEELRNSLCNVICPLVIDDSPKVGYAMLGKKFSPYIKVDKKGVTTGLDGGKEKTKIFQIKKENKREGNGTEVKDFDYFFKETKKITIDDLEKKGPEHSIEKKDCENKYYLTEDCDPMNEDEDPDLGKIFGIKEKKDDKEISESDSEEEDLKEEIKKMKEDIFNEIKEKISPEEKEEKILSVKYLNLLEKEKYTTIMDFFKDSVLQRVESFVKDKAKRKEFGEKFKEIIEKTDSINKVKENSGKEEKPIGYCMIEGKEFKREINAKTNVVVSKKKKLPKILEEASKFLSYPVSGLHNTQLTNRLFRDASTPWPEISYQYFPIVNEDGDPDIGICCVKKGVSKNAKKIVFKVPDVSGDIKKLTLAFNPDTFVKAEEFYEAINSIVAFLYSYAFHYVPDEAYSIEFFSNYKLKDFSYMYALLMCLYGAPSGGFFTGGFKCEMGGKYEVFKLDGEALTNKLKLAKPDTPLMVLSSDAVDGDFINIVAGVVPDFQQGSMISTSDLKIAIIYGLLPFSTRTIRKTPYSEYAVEDTEMVMKDLASDARVYIAISNIRKASKFQDYLENGIRKWKTYNRADPANFTCYINSKGKYVTANDFYKNRKDRLENDNGWYYNYGDTLFVEEPKFRADIRAEKFTPSIKLNEEIKTELDIKNNSIYEITKESLTKMEDRLKIKFKSEDPDFEPENNMFKGGDKVEKETIKNKIIENLDTFSKVLLNFEQFVIENKPKKGEPVKKIFNSAKGGSFLSMLGKENKISKDAPIDKDKNVKLIEDICEKVSPIAPIYLLQLIDENNYRNIVDPTGKVLDKILEYLIQFNNEEKENIENRDEFSENKYQNFSRKYFVKINKGKNKKEEKEKEEEEPKEKKISKYGKKINTYEGIQFDIDEDSN